MFSVREKREIAEAVQGVLRKTNHPELPDDEIQFALHVNGAQDWSWADIRNNGAVSNPGVNPHNEAQDQNTCRCNGPAESGSGICHICHKMKRRS